MARPAASPSTLRTPWMPMAIEPRSPAPVGPKPTPWTRSTALQAAYPNGDKVSYAYDAAGNRLSQNVNGATSSYSYNAAGQLTTAGSTAYAYDAAGNLTAAGPDSFSWDWAGQLVQATVGGTSSSYRYDGDGG